MSARYVRRAVGNLASYVRTNMPTYLDTVESEESLTPGSLEDLAEVLENDAPPDSRSPLAQVFADTWQWVDFRSRMLEVKCTVAISVNGDADTAALSTKVERYITALLLCLNAGAPNLGSTVNMAYPTSGDRHVERGDSSVSRQIFFQDVIVHVQEL